MTRSGRRYGGWRGVCAWGGLRRFSGITLVDVELIASKSRADQVARGVWLEWFTVGYNSLEGVVRHYCVQISSSRWDTFVTMVEAAEFWNFCDRAVLHNLTLDWALLFERKVRAQLAVVAKVGGQCPF
jgi:hypothetical protein